MALTRIELTAIVAGQLLSSRKTIEKHAIKEAVGMASNVVEEAEAYEAAREKVLGPRRPKPGSSTGIVGG
jgi:hypothetical protein